MLWMLAKIGLVVGERFARPTAIGLAILLLVGGIFLIGRCSKDDHEHDYRAQINQTNRSTDAATDAAAAAIEILEGRTATENAIDQIVTQTVSEIDSATDAEAIRAAVLIGVCGMVEHRNDPACTEKQQ